MKPIVCLKENHNVISVMLVITLFFILTGCLFCFLPCKESRDTHMQTDRDTETQRQRQRETHRPTESLRRTELSRGCAPSMSLLGPSWGWGVSGPPQPSPVHPVCWGRTAAGAQPLRCLGCLFLRPGEEKAQRLGEPTLWKQPLAGRKCWLPVRGCWKLCPGAEALFSLGVSVVSCSEPWPSLEWGLLLLRGLDVGVLLWAMRGRNHPEACPSKLPLSCSRRETSNLQAKNSRNLLVQLLAWRALPGSSAQGACASQQGIWKWFVQEMGQGTRESWRGPGRLCGESASCGSGTRAIQPSTPGTLREAGLPRFLMR